VFGRLAQLVEAGDVELVVELAHGLCPEPRDSGDLDQRGGELRLQLRGGGDLAGLDERDDLLLERVADPGQARGLAGDREIANRDRALADHPRRLLVGDHAEAVGAIELVEDPELDQGVGDLGVSRCLGHRLDCSCRLDSCGCKGMRPCGLFYRRTTRRRTSP
jgi:hypothetical protein